MEGFIQGHRVWIPRHVMAMDKFERKLWIAERGITDLHEPHWDGPGTTYAGAETLASMTIAGSITGPTNGEASMLTRECLEPVAPNYFKLAGARFSVRAHGTILGTTAITTQQVSLFVGPTYASPIAGQMIGKLPAAQTPGTTGVVTDWWLDAMVTVRVTGPSGSLICMGNFVSNMVTNATWANTPFKNNAAGTAASPVVMTGTGGLLVPIYFDLTSNQAAATASNSATCLDYTLLSLN
jgi:hypothetical protein